jgi:ABC-type nickel/cobalt efflux system permease component RcnA
MAAGLVPCPLTTFIMTYAASREEIAFGIVFAAGTIVTVAAFPIAAILFRTRLLRLIERTSGVRHRLGRAVEVLPPAPSCCWASSQSSGGACDAAVGYG